MTAYSDERSAADGRRPRGLLAALALASRRARGVRVAVLSLLALSLVALEPVAARASSASVYVADFNTNGAGGVFQYDRSSGGLSPKATATAAAGANPIAVAASPDGKSVYVVDENSNGLAGEVSEYDVGAGGELTPKAIPSVAAGADPVAIAVSPDGKSVYVANSSSPGAGGVSEYDVGSGGELSPKANATVASGAEPYGIAVSPDGTSVYVATFGLSGEGGVSQYDVGAGGELSPKATPTVAAGRGSYAIAVSPDGSSVYVTNSLDNDVSQYDVGAGGELSPKATPTVAAGDEPGAIAVSPDGTSVYVANSNTNGAGGISQYDVGGGGGLSPKATATVAAGNLPQGIVVSPDGVSVYVTNALDNDVSQYTVESNGELLPDGTPTVAAGYQPVGIVALPDQGPVAGFTATVAPAGSPTAFDGTGSSDADGTIARYDWNFGDGTTSSQDGSADGAYHTYSAPGSYTVTLTVTDDGGCSSEFVFAGQTAYCNGGAAAVATRTITVPAPPAPPAPPANAPTPPHAAFSFSPPGAECAPQKVYFDASASIPGSTPISGYHWSFTGPTALDYQYWVDAGEYSSTFGMSILPLTWAGVTTTPTNSFDYFYATLWRRPDDLSPAGVAVLGTVVTLTVEDADGLTDSVTHTVPFQYGYIGQGTPWPPCQSLAQALRPPVLPSVPLLLSGSTISVGLGCRASVCAGLIELTTVLGRGGAVASIARANRRLRGAVVGEARFVLGRGRHAKIRIRLNKRGQALARQGRLRKLRITVTTPRVGRRGKPKTVSRVLTVRRARG